MSYGACMLDGRKIIVLLLLICYPVVLIWTILYCNSLVVVTFFLEILYS
uniref:Uncharacterized protein n=1 Tax=Arundo donax TaxID=35708 RepID=A0A0A8ZTR2_ARUDO